MPTFLYPYYRVLLSFKIIFVAAIPFPCSTGKKAVATVMNYSILFFIYFKKIIQAKPVTTDIEVV
jgi:hypothetical protein